MKQNNKKAGSISLALRSFVKIADIQQARSTKNCVIYTRVSSKEQAENNTSLDSQKKYCEEYCAKYDYSIKAFFGGTYESAKDDERKEFQKMLAFVKKNKNIDSIIVYSYDRFSRTGLNAAHLVEELQNAGVKLIAVSQQIDTSTPSGRLQRNILNVFSHFDNEQRREKIRIGTIENLRQGYWVHACPFGYTNLNKKEKAKNHNYVINSEGEFLREAFRLKAEGNLTNKEIVLKLQKKGSKIHYKSFVSIISNPFYCGLIINKSLIPGEIYPGHHPAIVSEAVFAAANHLVCAEPRAGIAKKYKINELPLKIFAKAEPDRSSAKSDSAASIDNSGATLTGYRKKGIYYYKSRQKGNAVNVNAAHLNNLFSAELRKYEYEKSQKKEL